MQSISLQTHSTPSAREQVAREACELSQQRSQPARSLHPEIIEAVVESSLEAQALELKVRAPQAEFCDTHLALKGSVCPDPLLAMEQMGEALAQLPDPETRRVSFSGEQADGSVTWIGFIDLGEFVPPNAQQPGSQRTSVEEIERFITDRSSWFTAHVRETPRLHQFAKQSQKQRIHDTARAISLLLQPHEQLVDVLPIRYRRKSSSLLLTDQRILCLGSTLRSYDAKALLSLPANSLDLPLSQISEIKLAPNGMIIHRGDAEHCIYFSAIDIDSLEILLTYFTRVVRRPLIPETARTLQGRVARAGLVASLVCAAGLTVSSTSDFLVGQIPKDNLFPQESQSLNPSAANASLQANLEVEPQVQPPTFSEQCIERFNSALSPNGYAVINRATKTMLIHLERFSGNYINGFQFDELAETLANDVFKSCNDDIVDQVRVEDGYYSFTKQNKSPSQSNPAQPNQTQLNPIQSNPVQNP